MMQTDLEEAKLVFSEPVWKELFNSLSNSQSKIFYVFSNRNKNIMIVANSIWTADVVQ